MPNSTPLSSKYLVHDMREPRAQERVYRLLNHDADRSNPSIAGHFIKMLGNIESFYIVEESDYVDDDHMAALARFYRFRNLETKSRCRRLHLLMADAGHAAPLSLDRLDGYRYLGYIVLRPFPHANFGRSLLSPRWLEPKATIGCVAMYRAHLAGKRFDFEAVPWIQQDQMVSACASAALFVCTQHLAHFLDRGQRLFSTAEITDLATTASLATGRAMPSGGLNTDQMAFAFREMGYEPQLYLETESITKFRANDLIHTYVSSGIPIVLSLLHPSTGYGHAITVVGHRQEDIEASSLDRIGFEVRPDSSQSSEIKGRYSLESGFCKSFVVQDDASGPFRTLELFNPSAQVIPPLLQKWMNGSDDPDLHPEQSRVQIFQEFSASYGCGCLLNGDDENPQDVDLYFLLSLMVPLPPKVTLDAKALQDKTTELLGNFASVVDEEQISNIHRRTFLIESNRFKTHCREKFDDPESISQRIALHPMPKWIWVVEFSTVSLRASERMLGMAVIDAGGIASAHFLEDLVVLLTQRQIFLFTPENPDLEGDANFAGRSALHEWESPLTYTMYPHRA
jgi:hypothetical protein